MTARNNKEKKPFFTQDILKQFIALLLAVIAIQSALLSYWKDECGVEIGNAQVFEKRYQTEAETIKNIGQIKTAAYTEMYERWLEMNSLANIAYKNGDEGAAQHYWYVSDQILANMNPLLSAPYFDFYEKAVGTEFTPPDVAAFEADTYLVQTVAYNERFDDNSQVVDIWRAKNRSLANLSLLLTVGLFLLGNALNVVGTPRWLFMVSGITIAAISLTRMVTTYTEPVPSLPEKAISSYAEGIGWAHQNEYEEAVESFSDTLAVAPDYANAFYQRGVAYRQLGQLDKAINDFNAAIETGRGDDSLLGELAVTYYLEGSFDESIRINQEILQNEDSSNAMLALFNLGLNQLARGDAGKADSSYQKGIAAAANIVMQARSDGREISGSEWWALDQAATNLDFLLDCWEEKYCEGTPPYEEIAAVGTETQQVADALSIQLKEAMVALEYTGKLPDNTEITAEISDFHFFNIYEDEEGKLVPGESGNVFTSDSRTIMTGYIYENMKPGQQVLLKVYVNGDEAPSLRVLQDWPAGAVSGTADLPLHAGGLRFETGFYWVELYIDSRLVYQDGFEMQLAEGSGLDAADMDAEAIGELLRTVPARPGDVNENEDSTTEF